MFYLLLGKDDYSKKDFLKELSTREKADGVDYFYDWQEQPILTALKNSGLFAKKKMVVVFDQLGKFDFEEFLARAKGAENILVFVEQALDRRKTETKKILANKALKVVEFEIPSGAELRKWTQDYAKKIGLRTNAQALDLFFERLTASSGEYDQDYDLWQASSELDKFKVFAGEKELSAADVAELGTENIAENVFKITNAIADKDKRASIKALTDYLDRLPGTDEKSKILSLSAILAEQFRGILIIQGLLADRAADAEIIKQTGYSSGRLFIYKKIAKNFKADKIVDALRKIELLDAEIKTSTGPAGLQFLMIVNSVLA